jgi:hypothetical protein
MDEVELSIGEWELYQKLEAGVLRSCSGSLDIHVRYHLRAYFFFFHRSDSRYGALGSPLSPESNAA